MTKPLKHEHLLIRAKCLNPPGEDDEDYAITWMKELIDGIGMNLLSGPHFKYVSMEGNAGITMQAIIETSHIAVHIWDEQSPALVQMDVYSCSTLDPKIVFEYLEVFGLVSYSYKFLDRENGFTEIETGDWHKENKDGV